jgi:hypothetical protein
MNTMGLKTGQSVRWNANGIAYTGTITRFGKKYVQVHADNGDWMMWKLEPISLKVI